MASSRIIVRASRLSRGNVSLARPFSSSPAIRADEPRSVPLSERCNDTAEKYRSYMINKPLNPHLTNTTSTIGNEFPSLGSDKPPADQLTSVDPNFTPKDSSPENTERMTGGTQPGGPSTGPNSELGVGEIQGGKFKVEPHRRKDETEETMRARLLYQSRKRGTLESDLLLSTFADAQLARMTIPQMEQYDAFLDENDWDIYYWATQQPSPTSMETAEGGGPHLANPNVQGSGTPAANEATASRDGAAPVAPSRGEWSNTVGTFKPAYRPVPARWRSSEILAMLRRHVVARSAGGVHDADAEAGSGSGKSGGGLAFMPELKEGLRKGAEAAKASS